MCAETTVDQACTVWLAEVRAAGRIEVSSVETHETTVRLVVVPICGAIRLGRPPWAVAIGWCARS